jgi:O-antigen ligase
VSVSVEAAPMSLLRRYWRDRALWTTIADVYAILTALALPWSTSLVAIFMVLWLGAVVWVMDWRAFGRLLKRPVCYLPLALVGLAVVGTLWSDAERGAQLKAISPTLKLLVLPVLIYHFERSSRGMWVFIAFLVSCALLMLMSCLVAIEPSLSLKAPGEQGEGRGIFVKNYIAQSQEFTLCAVALAYPVISLLRSNRIWQALALGAVSLGFLANMALVTVSRTAIVTMPIMVGVFALLHLKRRTSLILVGVMLVMAGLLWFATPDLRWSPQRLLRDYQYYKSNEHVTSVGQRLEFWQKSLRFISEAPIIGHGTGSMRGLFERASTNGEPRDRVIANPHNQTLNIAVQWGIVGVVLLYAMWLVHLLLFRGEGLVAWIGLLVVVQNIFTSLFNSHIFDFHEGWMYVLGVGVAGGMIMAARQRDLSTPPAQP